VPLHPQRLNFNTSVKFGENYIALIKGYMLGWKRRKKKRRRRRRKRRIIL